MNKLLKSILIKIFIYIFAFAVVGLFYDLWEIEYVLYVMGGLIVVDFIFQYVEYHKEGNTMVNLVFEKVIQKPVFQIILASTCLILLILHIIL